MYVRHTTPGLVLSGVNTAGCFTGTSHKEGNNTAKHHSRQTHGTMPRPSPKLPGYRTTHLFATAKKIFMRNGILKVAKLSAHSLPSKHLALHHKQRREGRGGKDEGVHAMRKRNQTVRLSQYPAPVTPSLPPPSLAHHSWLWRIRKKCNCFFCLVWPCTNILSHVTQL